MSGHYRTADIEFRYPESWLITDEETNDWPQSVSVQSPQGSFWTVMLYENASPKELADEVLASMREEYADIEVEPHTESREGIALSGYDMYFCCLDLVVHARTLAARVEGRTLVVLWQVEDRENRETEQVFSAITTSLLRGLVGQLEEQVD